MVEAPAICGSIQPLGHCHALGLVIRKADARIAYRDQKPIRLDPGRCDGQFTTGLSHRLDAVEHQVHQNLLQLYAIRCRPEKPPVEFRADGNGLPIRRIPQQNRHLSKDFVQVDHFALWRASPVK